MKKLLALALCLFALSAHGQVKISDLTRVDPALGADVVPMSNTSRSTSSSYILSVATIGAYVRNAVGLNVTAGSVVVAEGTAGATSTSIRNSAFPEFGLSFHGNNSLSLSRSTTTIWQSGQSGSQGFFTVGLDSTLGFGSSVTFGSLGVGDAAFSRISAGVVAVGTGAAGSTAGAMILNVVTASATVSAYKFVATATNTGLTGVVFQANNSANGSYNFVQRWNSTVTGATMEWSSLNSNNGSFALHMGNQQATVGGGASLSFTTGRAGDALGDAGISRSAAGVIAVGTGAAGSTAGAIVAASYWTAAPNTVTDAAYTVPATASYIVTNVAGTVTVTLPAAASFAGRNINIRTITANTVVSASSNVVPVAGGGAGTAILAATAGKWARLVSDGTNWNIEMSN